MHGARGSGAPLGNRNAWRHGRRSRAARELRLLQRLATVLDAALMADLRTVDVVARGRVEEFDATVRAADARYDEVRKAAAVLRTHAGCDSDLLTFVVEVDALLT